MVINKKKSKTSPTQKSLKWLRDNGYTAQVVEKWNSFAKVRQDLFGVIDIVAIHPEYNGVLGVQCTTKYHLADRVKKSIIEYRLKVWLSANNRFIVHGWDKGELKIQEISKEDEDKQKMA